MKKINVVMTDFEYQQYGINKDQLSFDELVDIVNKELSKQTLNRCIQLAEKYNLSSMTMDEINEEVKAIRREKNNS